MANSFFKIKQGLNLANYANEAALSSIPSPQVGDLVTVGSGAVYTYNGSNWVDVGSSGSVVSVNGQTGVVSLDTGDIPEDGNLYFTDARAQSAAVINSLAGSETDKAPSVSSVNSAIRFLPENVRYVAKNGSDVTGNGSELAPFLTIQAAMDSLPAPVVGSDIPDCAIYVYPGVYNQVISWTRSNTNIIGLQAPRKNIQAVTIKGAIDFNIAIAEPGGIFQNINSISNCLLTNESGARNTINFNGSQRVILHLLNTQVYQAVGGYSAIYMDNTASSLSRLYADNCVIQSAASGLGHALDLVRGALWSCTNTEIYRTGSADASSRAIKMSNNSLVTGVKLSTIGSAGTYGIEMAGTGGCTIGTSVIETYSANKSGIFVAASTALTAINCVFNVVAGTGYAVDGAAGSFFAYSANTYAANALINPLVTKIQFSSDTTTSVIAEGTNQYFTAARAQTAAVVDSTAGSETNQAPSVSAMKAYVGSISSGVTSVNGDSGPAVSLDSGEIPEGSNLYFTDVRAQTAAVVDSTAGSETNQAPSVSAMKAYVSSLPASGVTSVNGDSGPVVSLDSGEIPEGSNLYFTDVRAQTAAVVDSTAGSETNQAPSVSAIKIYVDSSVSTEALSRSSADTTLQNNINSEAATRAAQDVVLDNKIGSLSPFGAAGEFAVSSSLYSGAAAQGINVTEIKLVTTDGLAPSTDSLGNNANLDYTATYIQIGSTKYYATSANGNVRTSSGTQMGLSGGTLTASTNSNFNYGVNFDSDYSLFFGVDSFQISSISSSYSNLLSAGYVIGQSGVASISDALVAEIADRQAADALLIPLSEKGAANGVATLDGSGLVPSSQLPAYPSVPVTSVNTQTGAVVLDTDNISESLGATNLWFTNARAQTAAVVNSTAGSETDQAPSVSAMKAYVSSLPSGGVTSVNGDTGPLVSLDSGEIPEGSNLYFTDARAQTAAVVNSTAGSETDQAASVSAMKDYVAASVPSGSSTLTTAGYALSSSALNTQTGSYTILSSDNGRIIIVNSASAVNITVPSGLDVGFNCMVVQIGAGQVTMVASGTTLNSAAGLKISAQHGALSIISYSSNVFNVAGNTAV